MLNVTPGSVEGVHNRSKTQCSHSVDEDARKRDIFWRRTIDE